jgi:hypothetical protein
MDMASLPASLSLPDDVLLARWPSLNVELLAEELAARLRPVADIWSDHGIILRADAEAVMGIPWVRQSLDEARARWEASGNAAERIKARARLSVEKSLAGLHGAINNPVLPLNHRTEALKLVARLGDVDGGGKAGAGAGGAVGMGVQIVIDLSAAGGAAGAGGTRTVNIAPHVPPARDSAVIEGDTC